MSNSDTQGAEPEQVVFIDANVPDLQDLLDGLAPGVQAFVLDPDRDGLQQIAADLTGNNIQNLSAISIVADGADGEIQLGNTVLSASNIATYQQQLAEVGAALKPGGDLLLYGCDVAQSSTGTAFLGDLAAATGVTNIAAASHVVGAAAEGGSWSLDVDLGTIAAAGPFTDATLAAYPDLLSISSNVVWFSQDGSATQGTGVYTIDVNGSSATNLNAVNSVPSYPFRDPQGIAIDPAGGHYFVVDQSGGIGNTQNVIIEGNINGSGTPSIIYTSGNSGADAIVGLTFNQQTDKLYFAVTDANFPSGGTDTGIYSISATGVGTRPATELVNLASGAQAPNAIAIDTADNLLFFTNGFNVNGFTSSVETVEVANLTTGTIINSALATYSVSGTQQPYGIAVDPTNHALYWTTIDQNNNGNNEIFRANYSIGTSVSLFGQLTLATLSAHDMPLGIALDVPAGVFYVNTKNGSTGTTQATIEAGSLTTPGTPTTVLTLPPAGSSPTRTGFLTVETQPSLGTNGTVSAVEGQGAVILDSTVTLSNADGLNLASATVAIATGFTSGDTLSFEGGASNHTFADGDTIGAAYNASTGVLTLSGDASAADYQSALVTVAFRTTSTSTTDASRGIDWTVTDGLVISPTTTSTVNVHVPPVVTAGATSHFIAAGSAVLLDSGLTVTDASSTTLVAATVTIVGFITGDTLNFTNNGSTEGNIAVSSNASGHLMLTSQGGTATLTQWDAALDSISYSFTPANGDPTNGGQDTSRTIDWAVNDGVLPSATATSTLDVAPCYCSGTLIEAARGQKSVEALNIGDKVRTASGKLRPIKWIGRRSYAGRFVMGRKDILPVCIKSGAIGENVPVRDLWVSPNHAMYFSVASVGWVERSETHHRASKLHDGFRKSSTHPTGLLIEAKDLINGVSIVQAERVESVEYVHIELDSHDVIIAEGALAESFIDDDSRAMFHNAHDYTTLYQDERPAPAHYCAPRLDEGYEVEAVRQHLALRAGLLRAKAPQLGALRGHIDRIRSTSIAGWAQNAAAPEAPVCLDIFADGKLIGRVLANSYRDDLKRAGLGSGRHAFAFVPPPGVALDSVEVRRSLDGASLDSSRGTRVQRVA